MSNMEFYTYRIGEVFKRFSSGKTLSEKCITPNGKYPVYGGNGLRGYTETSNFNGECRIVGRQGAKCGNVRYFSGEGYMTDHAIVGVANRKYDIKYLSYALSSLNLNRLSGQAAQPGLSVTMLKKQKILLPSYENQQKISKIINYYDSLIENNNKRIKILEQMAEELYKEWFVKCRFPDYQNCIFTHMNPTGWVLGAHNDMLVPENWHFGSLSEIGIFVRGKNITKDKMIEGEIPVVSAGIEPSGYHNEPNVNGISLTMSASGANAGYLKYNLGDIWAADCSYYQNDSNIWYVYHSLNFIKKAIENLQVGSAQPHVYPKNINKLCIMIPKQQYIEKFNELVKPFYREINTINQKNRNLIKQRDLLLPRLMSGKLEIK